MTESQQIKQLNYRVRLLQQQLKQKQSTLLEYQTIQKQADSKIKALQMMHAGKVKNLLNSIQILKKQKASIEGLSKQHKRSKLIQQLNKQILDQDIVIQVLRKIIYVKEGLQEGRKVCDEEIVKALSKGPERIRPLSREQLRMEIDKLKSNYLNLQAKLKGNNKNNKLAKNILNDGENDIDQSSVDESVSQKSFINQNDQIFKKLKQLQYQNQNMKLEVNAKLKIIQKLKLDLKQGDKLKIELQMYRNQAQIANKKVSTYERLMKQSKQNTNAKIIQLYQRQIKVEELEMVSKQNRDKLKQAHQTHNILLQEIKIEKQQLQSQIDGLKSQNQQIIMQNITSKKRLDELKKIIKDMDDLHGKQKEDMKSKLTAFEQQIGNLIRDNNKYKDAYRDVETTLFNERAQWVDQKFKLNQELLQVKQNKANHELMNKYLQDIASLRKQNQQLKQIIDGGTGGGGNDKILLSRLAAYEQKIKFLQNKMPESQIYKQYNQLLKKYEDLLQQFQNFKQKYGIRQKLRQNRKQIIELTQKEKSQYQIMSSGISKLNLQQIDSDVLDNFDSSLQYEFVINQRGEKVRMPKLTEADRQLLKLMTSDLWDFVTDDKMEKNIQKAAQFISQDEQQRISIDFNKITKLNNLSNAKGKKVTLYQEQINKLGEISDSVSITSAMGKELNKFDSDVNIEIKKLPKGATTKPMNTYKVDDISLSVDPDSSVSSAKLGESNIGKRKKKVEQKGSRIDFKKLQESQKSSDFEKSQIGSELLDSDVSSGGIRQSQLAMTDSDIQIDFRKKKPAIDKKIKNK